MKFTIGLTDNKPVKVDAFTLADTRGLICASSGAGKSWLLRLICECVAASIQTIIIDPEGEFPTLREKLDLLIVSETGDLRADVRSAGLLARKLAETGVSAVIDIYDLPGKGDPWDKRRAFLAEFITALMNLPKKSYHPMLVIVDEAHNFAPEDARGENAMHARSAIRSLMSAGRKRGFGGILATQRISKIDKDSIADARNVFIGGTTLDIDQKRAGDILGMNKAEYTSLRDLGPGEFYSFGPAVEGKGIIRFTSGKVETTHPKAGQRSSIIVPKASTQIETIAKQFGDLPAIAEEEVKSLESLKRENVDLRRQLRVRPTQTETKVETQIERVEVPIITDAQMQLLVERLVDVQGIAEELSEWRAEIAQLLNGKIESLQSTAIQLSAAITDANKPSKSVSVVTPSRNVSRQIVMPVRSVSKPVSKSAPVQSEGITVPQQRIIDSIAWLETIGLFNPKRTIIAFLAGQSPRSSGFTNNLGALRSSGLINYPSRDSVGFTEQGRGAANPQTAPITTEELQSAVLARLPRPKARILKILIESYPDPVNREELAERAGQSPRSSGYTNNLGALRGLGVIEYPSSSEAVALPVLFLE